MAIKCNVTCILKLPKYKNVNNILGTGRLSFSSDQRDVKENPIKYLSSWKNRKENKL